MDAHRSLQAQLERARVEQLATSARLEALGWLVRKQQDLAAELQRRLVGVKLPEPPIKAPEAPGAAAEASASAAAHLDAAHASLAQCVLALAAGGTAPASATKKHHPSKSGSADLANGGDDSGDDGGDDGVDPVDALSLRVAAALRTCSSLAQVVPLAEAAAIRRRDEQRASHHATQQRLGKAEAEAKRISEENRQLRSSVRRLRERQKLTGEEQAAQLTAAEREIKQLRLALDAARRRGVALQVPSHQVPSHQVPSHQVPSHATPRSGAASAGHDTAAAARHAAAFLGEEGCEDRCRCMQDGYEDPTGAVVALDYSNVGYSEDDFRRGFYMDEVAARMRPDDDAGGDEGAAAFDEYADDDVDDDDDYDEYDDVPPPMAAVMAGATPAPPLVFLEAEQHRKPLPLRPTPSTSRAPPAASASPSAPRSRSPRRAHEPTATPSSLRAQREVVPSHCTPLGGPHTTGTCHLSGVLSAGTAGDAIDAIASKDPAVAVSRRLLHSANLWAASRQV